MAKCIQNKDLRTQIRCPGMFATGTKFDFIDINATFKQN